MKEPKVIIDSNVLVSILKGSKSLSALYKAFKQERFKLIISSEILKELAAVLYRPSLEISSKDIRKLFKLIKMKAIRIKPRCLHIDICRDPADNFILELASEAKADFIVTGDKDLLVLKSFRKIPIITPKEFIALLKK
jgi:hypothetical protein